MENENSITLDSIAGYPELKKEGKKFIYILTHYQELKEKGAYISKGLILTGAPGVGKTLFAKAVANESKLPFFEFKMEDSNPVKAIHEAFRLAKEKKPSILFIDELNEILDDDNFISDESRKITQAFLTELDGKENSEGVFVIGTANRLEDLPEAIIRSGRMDKRIMIDMPNLTSRTAILEYYFHKVKTDAKISYRSLAYECEGMTGADIKNLINDTYIECESQGLKLTQRELENKIPEILYRDIRKKNSADDEKVICYHELGHLFINYLLRNEYGSVSLERFGSSGGHVTTFSHKGLRFRFEEVDDDNDEDSLLADKNQYLSNIAIALGGKASEQVFLHREYSGDMDDIAKANDTFYAMCRSGMLGFQYTLPRDPRLVSNNMLAKLDEKRSEILSQQYEKAVNLLSENQDLVNYFVPKLLKAKSLSHEDIQTLMEEYKASH